ncbi:hypothetical protein FEM48_Zijuj11G0095200 [Ziziphus jujuba var. spinosa]|uniref:Uncharacterized protein n=1 Tax=Ziziphus jujuba var. spinosa TaxID=714518 RepID=A0A978UI61_ZIZJJ|nr:hypothetical protein FEM48_Zijuj11G0095200 [Ziziphus jujuba var. spinosa]
MTQPDISSRGKRWTREGMTGLLTGGTRGRGHAIVEELAGFGATVNTCSRKQNELDRDQREKLIETVSSIFKGKPNILKLMWIAGHTDKDGNYLTTEAAEIGQRIVILGMPEYKGRVMAVGHEVAPTEYWHIPRRSSRQKVSESAIDEEIRRLRKAIVNKQMDMVILT